MAQPGAGGAVDEMVAGEAAMPAEVAPTKSLPELYREHRIELIRLGVLLLGDQPAAEDVVQDVFTAMWRRRVLPSVPGAALGYLRRAVVNGCRARLRRIIVARRKRPPADQPWPSPLEHVELAEEHREVLAALDRLPRRQREVLILRYYSGLTVTDAAETLGINEVTVRSTTSRGLVALRQLLEEVSG